LVQNYLATIGTECAAIPPALGKFDATLAAVRAKIEGITDRKFAKDLLAELVEATAAYADDATALTANLARFAKKIDAAPPATTKPTHAARRAFDPLAERIKGLVKQIDLLAKLAGRAHDELGKHLAELDEDAREKLGYDRRGAGKLLKQLDDDRKEAIEQLRQ